MAAAVPFIASVVVGMVVSKVVQEIGPKIGLSEDMSNMLGMVAGAYAGGMTYGAMSPTATSATEMTAAGSDLGSGVATAGQIAPSEALTVAENVPAGVQAAPGASGPHPSVEHLTQPPAGASQLSTARTGMMSEPSALLSPAQPAQVAAQAPAQAQAAAPPPAPVEQSWTERLFSPERTMDMVMAAAQGWGQAGMAQETMEYDEKVATKNAKDWAKDYPGKLSIGGFKPPSQQGQ
jgi:hypothetical protein